MESAPIDQWQDNGGWVYEDSILPVLEHAPYGFVKSGQVLHSYGSTHIRALDAGGHTPGHVAIEVRAADTGLLIAGDALHHPMQAQFPDLPFYADADPAQAVATRRALLGRCADENLKLLTAHFPAHSPLGAPQRCRVHMGRLSGDRLSSQLCWPRLEPGTHHRSSAGMLRDLHRFQQAFQCGLHFRLPAKPSIQLQP